MGLSRKHHEASTNPLLSGNFRIDFGEFGLIGEMPHVCDQANLHVALQRVCVQLASDVGTMGKFNIMWMSHADHAISHASGHFDKVGFVGNGRRYGYRRVASC